MIYVYFRYYYLSINSSIYYCLIIHSILLEQVTFIIIKHVAINIINVKNFHGSLTTVVSAQNDTTKTANITDTIFDRTLV